MSTAQHDDPAEDAGPDDARSGGSALLAALAVFAAVALAAAVVLGVLLVQRAGPGSATGGGAAVAPADDSVEAGFARDMQAHHRQAVAMSLSVLGATDDAEVRQLATDVLLTQQQQAGQMHGWLELWGLPQTGAQPVMAWMSHPDGGGAGHQGHDMSGTQGMEGMQGADGASGGTGVAAMPGMASAAQLARLEAAQGTDAERLYLQLMIPHHEAGVVMAQAALDLLPERDSAERSLAQAVVSSQTSELAVLRTLLDARGGPLAS
ncbi:DUF305 domain-containing protein [Quadrisphaera sp. KR29]|uniref:DUF305 domain-containing protein n=1 Tax=Quadrisphaera sp. KR29 TaxID=3461391 RepID=UPI004044C6D7